MLFKSDSVVLASKAKNPPAVFCRMIRAGEYFVKIGEHEYEIHNHGYYPPDKCVWWEAVNTKTNEADFHEHTKHQLLETMKRELSI